MKTLKYFNEQMTHTEALRVLYSVDGKTKEEVKEIKKEYVLVMPSILHRELSTNKNALTSYQI